MCIRKSQKSWTENVCMTRPRIDVLDRTFRQKQEQPNGYRMEDSLATITYSPII
jgi:hypothetical protein